MDDKGQDCTGDRGGPVHTLISEGTGYFSRGKCSTCDWNANGHIEDLTREFARAHQDPLPELVPSLITIPEPTGDQYADWLEWLIILVVTQEIDFGNTKLKFYASGLAVAWARYCKEHDLPHCDPQEYVADVLAVVSHLSRRHRALLRDQDLTRVQQQRVLNR